jgi:hypothetical protein
MKEAGEHGVGRHGGGASGCQTDLTNHVNSYVESKSFLLFIFFEQWKMTTMANPP